MRHEGGGFEGSSVWPEAVVERRQAQHRHPHHSPAPPLALLVAAHELRGLEGVPMRRIRHVHSQLTHTHEERDVS